MMLIQLEGWTTDITRANPEICGRLEVRSLRYCHGSSLLLQALEDPLVARHETRSRRVVS